MRIVNFGSLNNDFVYTVDHFVKPGETLLSENLGMFVGGKGLNQSIAAARAGVQVTHVGKIGNDGANLLEAMEHDGVSADFVERSEEKSGHAIIQIDQLGQNSIIIYGGANQDVDCGMIDRVIAALDGDDIILIQNEISNIAYIMKKA